MHLISARPRPLAIMLALVALALALLAPAASAQSYAPPAPKASVTGTPKAGGVLTISGTASPHAPVTVTLGRQSVGGFSTQAANSDGSVVLGSTVAGADGAYSLSVTVPRTLQAGPWFLTVASNGEILSTMAVEGAASSGGDTVADESAAVGPGAAPRAAARTGGLPVTGATSSLILLTGVGLIAAGGSAIVVGKGRRQSVAA